MELEKKIKNVLEQVRPSLLADGGDIEFVKFNPENGLLQVRFKGMCFGCPMAALTLNEVIATEVKAEVPEVLKVEAV